MLQSMSELLNATVKAEGRSCVLREVFFDLSARRIQYVALDIGGWLDIEEVLVEADRLAPPTEDDPHWHVEMTGEELAQAPHWTLGETEQQFDLTAWPPILVGPFGGTYSPMLLYEQMREVSSGEAATGASYSNDVEKEIVKLERGSIWIGLPAYGRAGELGTVLDILFDPETLRLETLKVGESGFFHSEEHREPFASVRHLAEQGTHVVLDTKTGLPEKDGDTGGA